MNEDRQNSHAPSATTMLGHEAMPPSSERLDRLKALRQEIAGLVVVKCRLAHERVRRDPLSDKPLTRPFPEGSYDRVGLCPFAVRAQSLVCSHSTSRIRLERVIQALRASDAHAEPGGVLAALHAELQWLDNEIHLLDHRKGEAEKTVADGWQAADAARVARAEDAVRSMEHVHDQYADRVDALKANVLSEIDRLIESVLLPPVSIANGETEFISHS